MRITCLFFCLMSCFSLAIHAQKAFKPVKTALKSKNYNEVIKQVNELEKDSLYMYSSKLCFYKIEALRGLNDTENMKLYLKQPYDTVAFFSTTYQIIQQTLRLDSIEHYLCIENEKRSKYSNVILELLTTHFPNLNAASRFFYMKKDYKETMKYLRFCLDIPHMPVGVKANLSRKYDVNNASLYLISAYKNQNYSEVSRYESLSLQDMANRSYILECLINTAKVLNDHSKYLYWLNLAWTEYPQAKMFFTKLADYYMSKNDYAKVLELSVQQKQKDSTDGMASLVKGIALFNLQHYDECIRECKQLLAADSSYVDANYYVGASYVAKGSNIVFQDNRLTQEYKESLKQQKEYYKLSVPYLETYKQVKPESSKRWAPLLYKVYLSLNEGKKFAEIEKFL